MGFRLTQRDAIICFCSKKTAFEKQRFWKLSQRRKYTHLPENPFAEITIEHYAFKQRKTGHQFIHVFYFH